MAGSTEHRGEHLRANTVCDRCGGCFRAAESDRAKQSLFPALFSALKPAFIFSPLSALPLIRAASLEQNPCQNRYKTYILHKNPRKNRLPFRAFYSVSRAFPAVSFLPVCAVSFPVFVLTVSRLKPAEYGFSSSPRRLQRFLKHARRSEAAASLFLRFLRVSPRDASGAFPGGLSMF